MKPDILKMKFHAPKLLAYFIVILYYFRLASSVGLDKKSVKLETSAQVRI